MAMMMVALMDEGGVTVAIGACPPCNGGFKDACHAKGLDQTATSIDSTSTIRTKQACKMKAGCCCGVVVEGHRV